MSGLRVNHPDLEEALRVTHEVAQAQRVRLDALREALLRYRNAPDRENWQLYLSNVVRCAEEVVGLEPPRASRSLPTTELLTAEEVAKILKLSKMAVYELARTKQLPSIRIGRRVRFDPAKVHGFLAQA